MGLHNWCANIHVCLPAARKRQKRSVQGGRALGAVVPQMCRLLVSTHPSRHRTVMVPLHGFLQTNIDLLCPVLRSGWMRTVSNPKVCSCG